MLQVLVRLEKSVKNWKPELLLIYVAFSWGLGFPLMKLVLEDNDTFTVLWMRFFLSALLFFPIAYFSKGKISKDLILIGIILGVLLFTTFSLFIVGLNYTSSVNTGFLAGLGVVFVPLIIAIIHRKFPSMQAFISASLGFIGLTIISEFRLVNLSLGDILVILGAFMSSVHIVVIDKYASRYDSSQLTFIQLLVMALLSLGVAGFTDVIIPVSFSWNLVVSVVLTAALATALAFWVQTKYQPQTTASRAVLIFSLEPIFSALFSNILLDEFLSTSVIAGGLVIFLAMIYPVIHEKIQGKIRPDYSLG
jgi:drug/metabolite transporter (DMT)-like permease